MSGTRVSHKRMRELGWERTDPKPWGKLTARWAHRDGWLLAHCGHPTAVYPWALYDPKGRLHCTGRADWGAESLPTYGHSFDSLELAAEYVSRDAAGAIAAMDREVSRAPDTVRWKPGAEPAEAA